MTSAEWGAIDSTDAFYMALDAGGEEFLDRNPEAVWWFVQLQYHDTPSGERLTLCVFLGDPPGTEFNAYFDPLTGDLLGIVMREG